MHISNVYRGDIPIYRHPPFIFRIQNDLVDGIFRIFLAANKTVVIKTRRHFTLGVGIEFRKSVPYFGETFITHEKRFFKETQQEFDADPEGEVPAGFDYDRFVGSQEDPKYTIDQVILYPKNKWRVTINENIATVTITDMHKDAGGQKSKVGLVKEKGAWKISECHQPIDQK